MPNAVAYTQRREAAAGAGNGDTGESCGGGDDVPAAGGSTGIPPEPGRTTLGTGLAIVTASGLLG